jgi:lipid-binding SYLF domain-containing protein
MVKHARGLAGACLLAAVLWWPAIASASSATQINRNAVQSLEKLYETNEVARLLAKDARGILVFPTIIKAGFMFGGQIGEGVLRKRGTPAGYYNSVAASYGLQAGVQAFGYALFFMDDASLTGFERSSGFEIGVGPSIVLVDEGVGRTLSTTTLRQGIYAFIFDQKGLMAGLGIQGSKITRIEK